MGLDPATKETGNIGGQVQIHSCRWSNQDVIVSVLPTDGTVAMYNNPETVANVKPVTVAGLPAVTTQVKLDTGPGRTACYIVADIPGGGALGTQITTRA
jgi:hypothetical protein